MTTIIAYILIAYGISATIVLGFALDSIGFWKQETLAAEEALHEAQAEIDDDNIIIAWQRKQISGHLKDTSLLLTEVEWWRNGGSAETELVAADLVDELDAWLAGEEVTG